VERMNLNATKPTLVRPKRRMNWGLRSLLVFVLARALAISALACPLWMGSMGQQGMPCSGQTDQAGRCPASICQLSSPYLASHVSVDVPILQEQPVENVDWAILGSAFANADSLRPDDVVAPDLTAELFLRFRSLLI
jgi:hypothetical protein